MMKLSVKSLNSFINSVTTADHNIGVALPTSSTYPEQVYIDMDKLNSKRSELLDLYRQNLVAFSKIKENLPERFLYYTGEKNDNGNFIRWTKNKDDISRFIYLCLLANIMTEAGIKEVVVNGKKEKGLFISLVRDAIKPLVVRIESNPEEEEKRKYLGDSFSDDITSKITLQQLNDIKTEYPNASDKAVGMIAAERVANQTIMEEATEEEIREMFQATSKVALGKAGAKKSKDVSELVFRDGKAIKRINAVKEFAHHYGSIESDIFGNYNLSNKDVRRKVLAAFLYENNNMSLEQKEYIAAFLSDVDALYLDSDKAQTDEAFINEYIDQSTYIVNKQKIVQKIYEEIIVAAYQDK